MPALTCLENRRHVFPGSGMFVHHPTGRTAYAVGGHVVQALTCFANRRHVCAAARGCPGYSVWRHICRPPTCFANMRHVSPSSTECNSAHWNHISESQPDAGTHTQWHTHKHTQNRECENQLALQNNQHILVLRHNPRSAHACPTQNRRHGPAIRH